MTDLNEMLDAWNKDTGSGRDAGLARKIASAYVDENPDKFADLEKLHAAESVDTVREHCVRKIDDLRAEIRAAVSAGDRAAETAANTEKLRIDTWLLSRLEPQEIVGSSGRRPRPELSAFLPLGLRREV